MLKQRHWILIVFLHLFWYTGIAQTSDIAIDTGNLKKKAADMAGCFLKADYKTFVKYTYPKVVQMMGGEEKMIRLLKNGIEQMKKDGYAFKSVTVELTSEVVRAATELHTLVLQRLILFVPGGSLTADSYLLAISKDEGKNWYFVDTAPFNNEQILKSIFPDYNDQLKIPEKPAPVFVKN